VDVPTIEAAGRKRCRKRTKNRGGRPLGWLKPETAFALGLALGRELPRSWTAVAKEAGIGKSTLYRWLRLGEAGDPRFAVLVPRLRALRESRTFWGS
jgi:hypothetical protein